MLAQLVAPLPPFQRVSAGFPGVVRSGRVVTAPHFVTRQGPGTPVDPALAAAWTGFDLATTLGARLGAPAKVANDADVQGAGVVSGHGVELVLTLGTGLGSAVFREGQLALHLELAHHPARTGATYNEYIGDAARKKVGTKRWNRRLANALVALDGLIGPDTILLGGGNAAKLDSARLSRRHPQLSAKVRVVGNDGGLLGGMRLWTGAGMD